MSDPDYYKKLYFDQQKTIRSLMLRIQVCLLACIFLVLFFTAIKLFFIDTDSMSPYFLMYLVENSSALSALALIVPIGLLLRKYAESFGLKKNIFLDNSVANKNHQKNEKGKTRIWKFIIVVFLLCLIVLIPSFNGFVLSIFTLFLYLFINIYAFWGKID